MPLSSSKEDKSTTSWQPRPPTSRKINLDAVLKLHLDDVDTKGAIRPDILDGSDYVDPESLLKGAAHCVFEKGPSKIYLGSKQASNRDAADALERLQIKGIVNCTNNLPCYHRPSIYYCCVPVNDVETANISEYFWDAASFMHHLVSQGESMLVHCQFGVSRSATIVMAFLMRYHNVTRDEAFVWVKRKRPKINPNDGFWKQLGAFEIELRTSKDPLPRRDFGQQRLLENNNSATHQQLHISLISFSTCRDVPELLDKVDCWSWLRNRERDEVLNAALDFVWGRGLGDNDLQWFSCVCDHIIERQGDESSVHRAFAILEDPNSEFCERWSGEVSRSQIQRVQHFLSSND